jgi:hypothetical protein
MHALHPNQQLWYGTPAIALLAGHHRIGELEVRGGGQEAVTLLTVGSRSGGRLRYCTRMY